MEIINHKIGEVFTLLVDKEEVEFYRVHRSYDDKYFNRERQLFENWDSSKVGQYTFTMYPNDRNTLKSSRVNFLPKSQQDLIFEFLNSQGEVVYRERHLYGGFYDESQPDVCVVYGTVYDPTGRPIPNTEINASLNKKGYFIDKVPVIGPMTKTVSDDKGYFELPLIQGINVTITIPSIGFRTDGYVPKNSSVALSGYCLLREGYEQLH